MSPAPPPQEHTTRSLSVALFASVLLAGVAGGIAFPILPIVGIRLGLSVPFIGVILAANRAMRVVFSPFVGIVTDRWGGRRVLLLGLMLQVVVMGLYTLGILLHRPGAFFLAGRLVHGPASACVFVSAQAMALHVGGSEHGGRMAGTVRASLVLGVPLGLFVGGLLSDAVGDAGAFGLAALAVVFALLDAWRSVPDLRPPPVKRRPPILETLKAMRDRRLLAIGTLKFALSFAAGGMILTTLALLVHARHLSLFGRNEQATGGLLMGLMTIVDAASTPIAGRIGDRWHAHARVATAAIALLVPGLLVVGFAPTALGIGAGLVLVGMGAAGLSPSLLVLMGRIVPQAQRGTGTGLLQLCGDVGGTLGPLVGTALFAGSTAIPYLLSAALLACFVPVAASLVKYEREPALVPAAPR